MAHPNCQTTEGGAMHTGRNQAPYQAKRSPSPHRTLLTALLLSVALCAGLGALWARSLPSSWWAVGRGGSAPTASPATVSPTPAQTPTPAAPGAVLANEIATGATLRVR